MKAVKNGKPQRTKKRNIYSRALSLLLASLLIFCACAKDGGSDGTDTDGSDIVLNAENAEKFQIVCPDKYTDKEQELCRLIQSKIADATGAELALTTDFVKEGTAFVEKDYEILIGDTNREASGKAMANIDKLGDWCIYSDSKKIAICGGNDASLENAVNEFISSYCTGGLNVPASLEETHGEKYQIDGFTISGTPLKEYSVVCADKDSELVKAIVETVEQYVGYTLPVITKSSNPAKEFLLDVSANGLCEELSAELGATQSAYRCVDGAVVFAAGKYNSDLSGAVISFLTDVITSASGDVTLGNTAAAVFENDRISVSTEEYMATLQTKADTFKNGILNSTADYSSAKRVFYVSQNGSDTNNGTSPEKAWKTLGKANMAPSGSVILIECGYVYRGYFGTASGLTYSHYGDVSKGLPIFNGSRQNYADATLWQKTEYENVWECTLKFNNVGIIAFDHDYTQVGDYDALVGKMLFDRTDPTLNQKDLDEDLEFYCNTKRSGQREDKLYVYSAGGNPGERFSSIEIGENISCIGLSDNVVIDGVRVMYSGGVAVGSGGLRGATVKNCVLEWIGGSKLSEDSTYGNAIQVYGYAINCTFDHNWCYQIYDCGITIQHTSAGTDNIIMQNVSISDNLLEYCYWGIEYWNQKSDSHQTEFENIRIDGNHIRFTGYGWGGVKLRYGWYGSVSLAEQSSAICCFGLTPNAKDVYIRNNVLELGYCNLIRMDYYGGEDNDHEGNTYIQYVGNGLCRLYGTQYSCGKTSGFDVSERLGDKTYAVVVVEGGKYEDKLLNK